MGRRWDGRRKDPDGLVLRLRGLGRPGRVARVHARPRPLAGRRGTGVETSRRGLYLENPAIRSSRTIFTLSRSNIEPKYEPKVAMCSVLRWVCTASSSA